MDVRNPKDVANVAYAALQALRAAIPLAVRALEHGGVPVLEQQSFWGCLHQLEEWGVEAIDPETGELTTGSCSIGEALRDLCTFAAGDFPKVEIEEVTS